MSDSELVYVSNKYKYVMILFRKSGCTTLNELFEILHVNKQEFLDTKKYIGRGNTGRILLLNKGKFKDYYKFVVIRNSFIRVISMYFNRRLHLNTNLALFSGEKNISFKACLNQTFNDFVLWLENNYNNNSDLHFSNQLVACRDKENFNYIALEDFPESIINVYKNMDIGNEKLNCVKNFFKNSKVSRKESTKISKAIRDKNIDYSNYNFIRDDNSLKIGKEGVPCYEYMYNRDIVNRVRKICKEEIELYNFKYPWKEGW